MQASDLTNDLSDDDAPPLSEPVDPLDSIDGSEDPELNSALQGAGITSPRQPIRAYRGRETTPLLRKAASFTVFPTNSTPAARLNYKSLRPPDDLNTEPQNSTPIPAIVTVEHDYNGKSTYGQTVSRRKNYLLQEIFNIGQLFNCIAVLLGIGMLSEPLAFAYAGWLWGTVLIIFFGFVTCYT